MPYDDSSVNIDDIAPVVHVGHCIEVLKTLPADHFHTCVTSPPYFGLRNYGVDGQIGLEPTPDEFVAGLVEVFREVGRVLRPDGTLWLNLGDSYSSGGRKTQVSDNNGNRGRTYTNRPNDGAKPKDLLMIPSRVALALQADGWYLRSHIVWHKPNVMPESVKDRPTNAHESIFLLTRSAKYYYDADAVKEPETCGRKRGPALHPDLLSTNGNSGLARRESTGFRNLRNVWTVPTKPFRGAHFATFPPELIEPCIKAGSPVGGHVLDPFGGSGTTGLVAKRLQRQADLIELNPEYAELARARIAADLE